MKNTLRVTIVLLVLTTMASPIVEHKPSQPAFGGPVPNCTPDGICNPPR